MAHLQLKFLGTFAAYLGGAQITTFGTAKVQALLAYLAVEQGQIHQRNSLATMLWPEQGRSEANTSFRQALSRLQRIIGNRQADPPFLLITRHTLQWNEASDFQIDVQDLLNVFNVEDVDLEKSETFHRLEAELAGYPGDFLVGFSLPDSTPFDTWVSVTRERIFQQVLDCFARLIAHCHISKRYVSMAALARRQLALSPWNEETHRQLMLALAFQGRRNEALAQFDRCFEILQHELGVEPDGETEALYQAISRGEISAYVRTGEGSTDTDATGSTPAQVFEQFALPLATVPEPAFLPVGSLMPLRRNPLFVGREADLRQLASALDQGGAAAVSQVETAAATGLGGIGKTQLACEFVHRYGQFFPGGVFWMSFDNAESIPAEIAACGGAGALELRHDFGNRSLDEQVRLVQAAWQKPIPRLLVFDNCEDLDLLERWRPSSGGCRIIITSRRGDWEELPGVSMLALGVLSREESVALLHGHRPHADAEILSSIAEELGDLPLALHLAGSYLYRYRRSVTPSDYLSELQNPKLLHHPSLISGGISLTGHVQHVGRTFALSFDKLDAKDERDALALRLLVHAAHFAPGEPIWYTLLVKTLGLEPGNHGDAMRADEAFQRLIELGIIETEEQIISDRIGAGTEPTPVPSANILRMHRLVAAFVRDVFQNEVETTQKAVETVVFEETANRNREVEPLPLLAWQSHLRAVVDLSQVRADEESARLCNELGVHLYQIGDYKGAEPYLQKAITLREAIFGPRHLDKAEALNVLGRLYIEMSESEQALSCIEGALKIQETQLASDDIRIGRTVNLLGLWHFNFGDIRKANRCFERALKIGKIQLGPTHKDVALYENNLGDSLRRLGKHEAALKHFERALEINEIENGPEHFSVSINLNNLGIALHALGRLDEARVKFERALAIRQKVFGLEHVQTALTLSNLGSVLRDLGELEIAYSTLNNSLTIFDGLFEKPHTLTAFCLNNLGLVCQDQKKFEEAHHYFVRALKIRKDRLSASDPLVALSLCNLGTLCIYQGKQDDAHRYLTQAYRAYVYCLGADHWDTVAVREQLNNLTNQKV